MTAPRWILARPVVAGLVAAALVGVAVLAATQLRAAEYQGRVSVVAAPSAGSDQFGEVVSLTLPALVELARSPSVLRTAARASGMPVESLVDGVAVELVPASGLARISVLGPSGTRAGAAATAVARAMIAEDLLAPAGALRMLDERPDVTRVAPDRALGAGLALVAAAAAGVGVGAAGRLRRSGVRTALASAGVRRPVGVFRLDDPDDLDDSDVPARLGALCAAAARPTRVVAVTPELAEPAERLAERLPDKVREPAEGSSVVAVAPGDGRREELVAAVNVLPADAVLVAVVLVGGAE